MNFNCWKENVKLVRQLCKDEGLKCVCKKLHTDCDGDTLYSVKINGQWSNKTQDYYNKNRVRK